MSEFPTRRNLNTTWQDILYKQYKEDYDADVPYPVRYLLNHPQWKRDLFYEIHNKIDLPTLRKAIIYGFHKTTRRLEILSDGEEYIYEDENIKVRPRKKFSIAEIKAAIVAAAASAPTTEDTPPAQDLEDEDHDLPSGSASTD